jgi:hypothetical protein
MYWWMNNWALWVFVILGGVGVVACVLGVGAVYLMRAFACHKSGRTMLSARCSHRARLTGLLAMCIVAWDVGIVVLMIVASGAPSAANPIIGVGLLGLIALTALGLWWLPPLSKARYTGICIWYTATTAPLPTDRA